jgi:hypothetical protein
MIFLLIAALAAAMILLYVLDRILKAFARARRYRAMSERLDATTAKTEAQQEQRKAAAAQSAALTSVMPAINLPPLTLPGLTGQPPRAVPGRKAKPGDEPKPRREPVPGREASTGSGEHPAGTVHPRALSADRSGRPGRAGGPRQPHHR